jgi:hypothetical protein
MREESMGVMVKETNSETSTAKVTVIPNWKKNRPTIPFITATGTNTATMENVVASTASPISAVASAAARRAGLPISRWRWMFSMTTMASSTRIPIDSDRASMVMLLKVKPITLMKAKVATTEVGIARALIRVARKSWRKIRITTTASRAPNQRSKRTSSMECSMKGALSVGTERRAPALAIWARSASTSLCTSRATSTVFAPDCLRTTSPTAEIPFMEECERASAVPSSTVATSPTRMRAPPVPGRRMSAISFVERTSPLVLTANSRRPSSMWPAGSSMFWACRAPIRSCTVRPRPSSRAGSGITWISRSCPPTRSTAPTPGMRWTRTLTMSSARWVNSRTGSLPDRATAITGAEPTSNFCTTGGSMPVGSLRRLVETRSRTSWAATSALTSRLNWTMS